jgi:urease accessory protein
MPSSNGSATACSLKPERVGRDGFLRLQFENRGGRTILAESRFSLPLQALTPVTIEDGTSYLMLLNPTGGVLGGDHLVTEIELKAGARACLTTPSATRIYRTAGQPAVLDTSIRLAEGAALEYLPDHVIAQAQSALHQSLRVELSPGSRAILLDSMSSGRIANGERWRLTELDSRIEVRRVEAHRVGRPLFLNRTRIVPGEQDPRRIGQMSDFDYSSCLGLFGDDSENWISFVAALNAELQAVPGIHGGVSLLAHGGCIARYLARSASDMIAANKRLGDAARKLLLRLPPFDHRKY